MKIFQSDTLIRDLSIRHVRAPSEIGAGIIEACSWAEGSRRGLARTIGADYRSWPGNPEPQSRELLNGAADNGLASGAWGARGCSGALGGSRDYIGGTLRPRTLRFLFVLF